MLIFSFLEKKCTLYNKIIKLFNSKRKKIQDNIFQRFLVIYTYVNRKLRKFFVV